MTKASSMSDSTTTTTKTDSVNDAAGGESIDVQQEAGLLDWSRRLGVTPEKIKEAVQAVGPEAQRVRDYLVQGQGAGYQ